MGIYLKQVFFFQEDTESDLVGLGVTIEIGITQVQVSLGAWSGNLVTRLPVTFGSNKYPMQ